MGPYPINAVRNLFGSEPTEVTAIGFKTPGREFLKMEHDTINVTLRFPEERMAQFVVGYAATPVNCYKVVGTKGTVFVILTSERRRFEYCFSGEVEVNPAFMFGSGVKIACKTTINGKEDSKTFPETDHFGGETEYFSECILNNVDPEADGHEGLNDVRVIVAIKESLDGKGKTVKIKSEQRSKRPVLEQVKKLTLGKEPKNLIGRDAQKPSHE